LGGSDLWQADRPRKTLRDGPVCLHCLHY
jgi:hypothetical protein